LSNVSVPPCGIAGTASAMLMSPRAYTKLSIVTVEPDETVCDGNFVRSS
jgi:hypothetical protein